MSIWKTLFEQFINRPVVPSVYTYLKTDPAKYIHYLFYLDSDLESDLNLGGRLIKLKDHYHLLSKDMASIMGVTYQTYQRYETNKLIPNYYSLTNLSIFTGVSLNWLVGTSPELFCEDDILRIENHFLTYNDKGEYYLAADIPSIGNQVKIYPSNGFFLAEEYYDLEKRRNLYSIEVRANIVYLLNKFLISCCEKSTFCIDQRPNHKEVVLDFSRVFGIDSYILLNELIFIKGNPLHRDYTTKRETPLYEIPK